MKELKKYSNSFGSQFEEKLKRRRRHHGKTQVSRSNGSLENKSRFENMLVKCRPKRKEAQQTKEVSYTGKNGDSVLNVTSRLQWSLRSENYQTVMDALDTHHYSSDIQIDACRFLGYVWGSSESVMTLERNKQILELVKRAREKYNSPVIDWAIQRVRKAIRKNAIGSTRLIKRKRW